MKARTTISEGGFSPSDVVFLTDVLETLWREFEDRGYRGLERGAAREHLAAIIIALAKAGVTDQRDEFCDRVKRTFFSRYQGSDQAAE